jgi:hypothetical protein
VSISLRSQSSGRVVDRALAGGFPTGPEPFHFGLLDNLGDFDAAAHEWVGLLYYRLRFTTEFLL